MFKLHHPPILVKLPSIEHKKPLQNAVASQYLKLNFNRCIDFLEKHPNLVPLKQPIG